MDLCSGLVQKNYQVTDVTGLDLPTERRLEALGLIKGTKICVLNKKSMAQLLLKCVAQDLLWDRILPEGFKLRR